MRLRHALMLALACLLAAALPRAAHAEPRVILSPASGHAGSRVVLSGTGFHGSRSVVVRQGHRRLARVRVRGGSFRARVRIPTTVRGSVRLVADAGRRRVVNSFQVTHPLGPARAGEHVTQGGTRLRWTPSRGSPGTAVTLRGSGFGRRRRVRVRLGGRTLARVRTNRRGRFRTRFRVPGRRRGWASFAVRGGGRRLHFRFRVTADPVIAAAGDIACDPERREFNGGRGTAEACHMRQTSDLILALNPDAVLPLGDIQYGSGRRAYALSYNPTWGRFKGISWPAPGNHDFYRSAGADYFEYFGPAVGRFHNAYYSFDVGAWHLVSLNSNYDHCDEITGVDCGDAAVQLRWLRQDLAAHRNRCVLAYFHHPRFSSGPTGNNRRVAELWNALDAARADVVLSGHDHNYERFGPQDGEGRADPAGVRQFVVGTGGEELQNFTDELPNSQAVDTRTFGVLALTLRARSYDWHFLPEPGDRFEDSGTGECH